MFISLFGSGIELRRRQLAHPRANPFHRQGQLSGDRGDRARVC